MGPALHPHRLMRYEIEGDCWLWRDALIYGYGQLTIGGKTFRVHRLMYEIWKGPIPAGLVLDHLCKNKNCVNPDHLEPVTQRENTMRSENFIALNARKTHCPQGHPYAGENLHLTSDGHRDCKTCRRARDRKYAMRKRKVVD